MHRQEVMRRTPFMTSLPCDQPNEYWASLSIGGGGSERSQRAARLDAHERGEGSLTGRHTSRGRPLAGSQTCWRAGGGARGEPGTRPGGLSACDERTRGRDGQPWPEDEPRARRTFDDDDAERVGQAAKAALDALAELGRTLDEVLVRDEAGRRRADETDSTSGRDCQLWDRPAR